MEENGLSYANDRQHVTTGHAPARATFLTESTRLSFPLSFSLCHPLHRLSSSHLSLLSFTLYPPFLSVFSSSASLYPCSSSSVPFFSSRNFQFLSLGCHSCVSFLACDLYLTNYLSIDLEFLYLDDKCWTLLIVEW